jgi:hypothetical protein
MFYLLNHQTISVISFNGAANGTASNNQLPHACEFGHTAMRNYDWTRRSIAAIVGEPNRGGFIYV